MLVTLFKMNSILFYWSLQLWSYGSQNSFIASLIFKLFRLSEKFEVQYNEPAFIDFISFT